MAGKHDGGVTDHDIAIPDMAELPQKDLTKKDVAQKRQPQTRAMGTTVSHYATQKLAEIRRRIGLSQAETARRMGTTQSVISEIETHLVEPRLSTLLCYARILGCRLMINIAEQPLVPYPDRTLCIPRHLPTRRNKREPRSLVDVRIHGGGTGVLETVDLQWSRKDCSLLGSTLHRKYSVRQAWTDDARRSARRRVIERFVDLRKRRKLSQVEVAKRMGTTQSAVSEMETGVTEPKLSTLQRYAYVLDCRLDINLVEGPAVPYQKGPLKMSWGSVTTSGTQLRPSDGVRVRECVVDNLKIVLPWEPTSSAILEHPCPAQPTRQLVVMQES